MIRLIIKKTTQPPFETEASVEYITYDIEEFILENIIKKSGCETYRIEGHEIREIK